MRFHQVVLAVWPTKEIEFANGKNKSSSRSNNLASWEHRATELQSYRVTFISIFCPPKGLKLRAILVSLPKKKLESKIPNLLFWWILPFPSPFFQCDIPKMRIKTTKQSSAYLLTSALESRGGSLRLPPTSSGSSRRMSGRYVTCHQISTVLS